MTGFNMPPGCNVSDIPGNNAPDLSPESEAWLELFEPIIAMAQAGEEIKADTLQSIADATVELIEHLVKERNLALEDNSGELDLFSSWREEL